MLYVLYICYMYRVALLGGCCWWSLTLLKWCVSSQPSCDNRGELYEFFWGGKALEAASNCCHKPHKFNDFFWLLFPEVSRRTYFTWSLKLHVWLTGLKTREQNNSLYYLKRDVLLFFEIHYSYMYTCKISWIDKNVIPNSSWNVTRKPKCLTLYFKVNIMKV